MHRTWLIGRVGVRAERGGGPGPKGHAEYGQLWRKHDVRLHAVAAGRAIGVVRPVVGDDRPDRELVAGQGRIRDPAEPDTEIRVSRVHSCGIARNVVVRVRIEGRGGGDGRSQRRYRRREWVGRIQEDPERQVDCGGARVDHTDRTVDRVAATRRSTTADPFESGGRRAHLDAYPLGGIGARIEDRDVVSHGAVSRCGLRLVTDRDLEVTVSSDMRVPTWPPDAPPARTRALATCEPKPGDRPQSPPQACAFCVHSTPRNKGRYQQRRPTWACQRGRPAARAALSGSGLDIERPLEPLGHVRLVDADELRQPVPQVDQRSVAAVARPSTPAHRRLPHRASCRAGTGTTLRVGPLLAACLGSCASR